MYQNNLKNGFYKKYTEKGDLLEESNFKNDLYDGLAIFRDGTGVVVSKGQFVKGKKEGKWQFYEKGKLTKEVNISISQNEIKSKK